MTIINNGVGETAEEASANVPGPRKATLLPVHPARLVVKSCAFISAVWTDRATGYAAVATLVVAGTMVLRLDSAHETARESLHKVLDGFGMALS